MLDRLQLVKSVTPLEVRKKADSGGSVDGVSLTDEKSEREEHITGILDESPKTSGAVREVDLGDLTEDQKIVVMNMLRDEAVSFSKDDEDVGCMEGLQLNINLSDSHPVQKNYTAIPKPLYPTVC